MNRIRKLNGIVCLLAASPLAFAQSDVPAAGVALIVDPIQIAETFGIHHGIRNQALEEWYARGYTPAGPEVWNAMHVGHTVDSVRLWDVMRAAQALAAQEGVIPERIMAVGRGVSGVLGLYAAILGAPIEQVTLIDPPSSHVEGPYFLNVLRHMDLPEAAALAIRARIC